MHRIEFVTRLRKTFATGLVLCLVAGVGLSLAAEDRELAPAAKAYYLYSLAQQARFRRNYLDAVDHLKRAVSHDPTSAVLHLELSRLYWQLRDRDRALDEGEKATRLDPDNSDVHRFLASCYAVLVNRRGESGTAIERAIHHHQRVLELESPEDATEEMLQLGQLYLTAERFTDAADVLEGFLEQGDPVPNALLWLSQAYAAQGRLDDGVEQLHRALELSPRSIPILESLAALEQRRGNPSGAVTAVEQLISRRPENLTQYSTLGLLLRQSGQTEKAIQIYRQADKVAREQTDLEAKAALADLDLDWIEALMEAGRTEGAAQRVRIGVEEFPGDLRFLLAKAQVEYGSGDPEQGRRSLEDLLETHPDRPGLGPAVGEVYLALAARLEGEGRSAEQTELLRRAIELNPRNDRALNFLGYLWADRGENLEESVTMLLHALEIRPDEPAYLDSLGWAYYRQGEFELALPQLARAIQLGGEEPVILQHLGDLYAATDRPEQALDLWRRSQAAGATNTEELEQKIEGLQGEDNAR